MRQLGYAGKVPHRGDFVRHNVPTLVHAVWDDWSSALLRDAEDRLDDWPAGYDAAPLWRFALSPDVAGEDARAGVLIASRDGIGRRYPFTVFATLDVDTTPLDALAEDARLDPLETLAREAYADPARYEALKASLEALQAAMPPPADPTESTPFRPGSAALAEEPAVFCEDALLLHDRAGTRRLLDATLRESCGPYSVWQRRDTPTADGRLLVTGGLPLGDAALALFGAEWPSSAGGRLDGCRRTDTRRPVASAPDAAPSLGETSTTRSTPPPDDVPTRRSARSPDDVPTTRSDPLPDATPPVHVVPEGGPDEPLVVETLDIDDEDEADSPWDRP